MAKNYNTPEQEYIERGNRIRQLREAHKQTQADLAADLGITRGYVGCLERGQNENANLRIYTELCKLYGVSTEYLLHGNTEKSSENDACRKCLQDMIEMLEAKVKALDENAKNGN